MLIHLTAILIVSVFFTELSPLVSVLSLFICLFFLLVLLAEGVSLLWFLLIEITLYPSLLVILLSGGQAENVGAAYFIALYTSLPSFLFLYPLILCSVESVSNALMSVTLVGMFITKSPLWFAHYWLPNAHVEASTSLSMVLAAILLKLGFVGMLFVVPFLSMEVLYWVILLSLFGLMSSPLVCGVSSESKVFAAYSSINHISFATYCLCSLSSVGYSSGSLLALGHSHISALIFHFIGVFSHVSGTRILYYTSSLFNSGVWVSFSVLLNLLSNGGGPPSVSFFGEVYYIISGLGVFLLISFPLSVYYLLTFYYNVYGVIHLWKSGGSSLPLEPVIHLSFSLNIGSFYFLYLLL